MTKLTIELLDIRRRRALNFLDNIEVTLRIFNRTRKVKIFRADLNGDFEKLLTDAEWVKSSVRYAARKLLSGNQFEREKIQNPFVRGNEFDLSELDFEV